MARLSSKLRRSTQVTLSLLLLSAGGAVATETPLSGPDTTILEQEKAQRLTANPIIAQRRTDAQGEANCPDKAEATIGEPAIQVAWYETQNHAVAICRTAEGDPYYHGIPKPSTNQVINDITLPAYRNGRGYSAITEAGVYSINDQELRITQDGQILVQESVLAPSVSPAFAPAAKTEPRFAAQPTAGWTLSFDANTNTENRIAFDINVREPDTTTDRKATLAQGAQIGMLQLTQASGRSLNLDGYQWAIDDQSRLYVGKSGYKYLLATYNYGRVEPTSYRLQMVCQTRASGSAACQLSDNGPLLNGQIVSQGQLYFGPTERRVRRTTDPTVAAATGVVKNIAPETTPDQALEQAILAQFSEQEQTSQTFRYVYNRADLNSDGQDEIFAYLENSSFCDGQRCPLLIFETQPSSYRLLTKLSLVAPPVIVNDSKTWGWSDLVFTDVDASGNSQYQMLRYTGKQYPQLSSAEDFSPSRISGTALLSDQADKPNDEGTVRDIAPARP
ncbi:MAG: hypothetical protein AAF329_07785 [Cyanobacteria bacterium P01_A01_bin.17]